MDTRILYLLIGCGIGFVLGYIVRSIREIKEKVEEVDLHVREHDEHKPPNDPNDGGFVLPKFVGQVALLLVVLLTAWSAFASQKATNDIKDTQAAQKRATSCTVTFLRTTISALNQRTTYTVAQANANVSLQQSFEKIVDLSLRKTPKVTPDEARRAVEEYSISLKAFLSLSQANSQKIVQNPYPTAHELQICLNRK
jgi:hypothetical protein